VLVGRVVDHEVDQHANAAAVRLVHELDEVAEGAEAGIDAVEVRDVVAVILVGRRHERPEPDRIDAERLEVVEAAHEPLEVAAPVAVAVHEGLDGQRVHDGVLVPEVLDHGRAGAGGRSVWRRAWRSSRAGTRSAQVVIPRGGSRAGISAVARS
jgi:hypothetical protein